jgi:uncharacterized protein (DUF1800 family)
MSPSRVRDKGLNSRASVSGIQRAGRISLLRNSRTVTFGGRGSSLKVEVAPGFAQMHTRRHTVTEIPRGAPVAVVFALLLAGACLATRPVAGEEKPSALTERQKIIHVLNRLGYGPRPGDIERIEQLGLGNYLRQQLHPETIDDSALEARLARFGMLQQSPEDLARAYQEQQRAIRELQRQRAAAGTGDAARPAPATPPARPPRELMEASRQTLGVVAELQNAKIIRAIESERQLHEVLVDFWSNHFNIDVRKGPCRVLKVADERDVIRPHALGKFRDLLGASAKSPAMLVYLDNAQSSAPRRPGPAEQRIRDRLRESAPGIAPETGMAEEDAPRMVGGINENYARELMELHTLGVNGGYTQQDVQEVARCFTGWTINPLTGRFVFTPRRHDNGEKTVLGHRIPANGGIRDGEMVLDILARHPSTATFLSRKLCQRLVADDPPAALVERVARVFRETDGDLRKVVTAIITSPEFFAPQAYRAKIKSPFEYVASAVRALGGGVAPDAGRAPRLRAGTETAATFGRGGDRLANARRKSLNLHIIEMGQPLYAHQAPTGWPEDSRKWVSTGALIARLNFALALAERSVVDASFSLDRLRGRADIDDPEAMLEHFLQVLLQGEVSDSTRATLRAHALGAADAAASTVNAGKLTALILGSPEFQRR